MAKPLGTTDSPRWKRQRAVELLTKGLSRRLIAERLDLKYGTVVHIIARARKGRTSRSVRLEHRSGGGAS